MLKVLPEQPNVQYSESLEPPSQSRHSCLCTFLWLPTVSSLPPSFFWTRNAGPQAGSRQRQHSTAVRTTVTTYATMTTDEVKNCSQLSVNQLQKRVSIHETDCCLSARLTATRAKTIRLRPKTSCHDLLYSSSCNGPIFWQTCLGAEVILQSHPSMRNSPVAVLPSVHQRWSSCRCHSHSLHCCHHLSWSWRIHNSVDEHSPAGFPLSSNTVRI